MASRGRVGKVGNAGGKKDRGRKKLTPAQLLERKTQRDHDKAVREVFEKTGFRFHPDVCGKNLEFAPHVKSELDFVFTFENLIVVVETTCHSASNLGDHLRKKLLVHDYIDKNRTQSLSVLGAAAPSFAAHVKTMGHVSLLQWVFVYASRNDFDEDRKAASSCTVFFDYRELRYFKAVVDAIKVSARPELLAFLQVDIKDIAKDGVVGAHGSDKPTINSAMLLPEANSGFPPGFAVLTFYASAKELLDRSYVLRRQGWRDSENVYQRLVDRKKIVQIREHLRSGKGTFVNNIIVTLDRETRLLDQSNKTVDPSTLNRVQEVRLQLPGAANTIGLIDGQHRTYAYHQTDPDESDIAGMRAIQNLLVTGIMFPTTYSDRERERFEAQLFLAINSTQTGVKPDLTQALRRVATPFANESLAYSVLVKLGEGSGPLKGLVALHWLESDKLKTASVVSFAMKPLVKHSGNDSLFSLWEHPLKDRMIEEELDDAREAYLNFCEDQVNALLIAFRRRLGSSVWSVRTRSDRSGVLTTTTVNAMLILLRRLVEEGKTGTTDEYYDRLNGIAPSDISSAASSRYAQLAALLFDRFFA